MAVKSISVAVVKAAKGIGWNSDGRYTIILGVFLLCDNPFRNFFANNGLEYGTWSSSFHKECIGIEVNLYNIEIFLFNICLKVRHILIYDSLMS